MKYTNHLNVIVAIIGVIVIAQTLTRTFWNSAPEKQYSLEVPASRARIQVRAPRPTTAGQKRSAAQAPGLLPGTVGAPSSVQPVVPGPAGGRSRLFTAPPVQPGTTPGPGGTPSGTTAAAPNVVTIPSGPTAPPPGPGPEGDQRGRSIRGQNPFGGRSTFRSQGGAESRPLNLPPPGGNDAAKRRPNANAPAPPVRSSMPEQRVQ